MKERPAPTLIRLMVGTENILAAAKLVELRPFLVLIIWLLILAIGNELQFVLQDKRYNILFVRVLNGNRKLIDR